jgi:hypothetical protein
MEQGAGATGEEAMKLISGRLTTNLLATLFALTALPSLALAENCRAFPPGPDRRACAMREHPELFQAKQEHCRELATQRGDSPRTGTGAGGMRDFVRDCMQGRQR